MASSTIRVSVAEMPEAPRRLRAKTSKGIYEVARRMMIGE
jgi:hypothetical protein